MKANNRWLWKTLAGIRDQKAARWAFRFLLGLSFIALFSNFLANDKPIYCKIENQRFYPVFQETASFFGSSSELPIFRGQNWYTLPYQKVWWPPIPYAAETLDGKNMNFRSPLGYQNVPSLQFRHWLGTDQVGRDVLAGLISGTRTTLILGMVTMGIVITIGILLGITSGYYGDEGLHFNRIWWLLQSLALLTGISWVLSPGLAPVWGYQTSGVALVNILVFFFFFLSAHYSSFRIPGNEWWQSTIAFPLDSLVMRTVEIIESIPTLFLLIAGVAVLPNQSVLLVMVWIGMLSWTRTARFSRAETMKIKDARYVEAARLLGISEIRILLRHILPNVIPPVLIVLAFGFSGVILLEAYLSFLGLGAAPDEVSWGSLIRMSANRPSAWWLAVFPGLAIFLTVASFNLIGEGLSNQISRD